MRLTIVRVPLLLVLLALLFHSPVLASSGGTLLEAIRRDDASGVKALIRGGADVNVRDEDGATPLMHAALLAGPRVVRQLIDGGAVVNAANRFGATALMWAV
jgi:ankyrin repeat protein